MSATKGMENWIGKFERETPEPKLELIDPHLVVGNSLAGSAYVLPDLLDGWEPAAFLPFAPVEEWREAIQQAFTSELPPGPKPPLEAWQSWAETIAYEPVLAPESPRATDAHHAARERLKFGADHVCGVGGFGSSFGHDFVMNLSNDAFTPDGMLIGWQATERLFSRYLSGPADLVWEVLLPGHQRQDNEVKFHKFEAGGVKHYWVVDADSRSTHFCRLVEGKYRREFPDADGRYRPAAIAGLAFVPEPLWEESHSPYADKKVFEADRRLPGGWKYASQEGIDWDDIGFAPEPRQFPRPIAFEQFASWCPQAKFEGDGERTLIGGRRGTRNVLGMLARTLGLVKTAELLHPRAWVEALRRKEEARATEAARRRRWWALARRAASRLRSEARASRIAVSGSLACQEPLHFWSELSLVAWDLAGGCYDTYEILKDLDPEGVIDLIDPEDASGNERRMIAEEAIEME